MPSGIYYTPTPEEMEKIRQMFWDGEPKTVICVEVNLGIGVITKIIEDNQMTRQWDELRRKKRMVVTTFNRVAMNAMPDTDFIIKRKHGDHKVMVDLNDYVRLLKKAGEWE